MLGALKICAKKGLYSDLGERRKLISRVDLHTPKMLIIQFHTSSVWENACHTIFIQFLKMVENWYKLISVAV